MVPQARPEYCRRCGALSARQVPPGDTRPRATCGQCGNVEYDNPKVVVSCPLYEGDRVLWVRRAIAPYAGCWAIPAGFVEAGETLEEAATREVFEETHLWVDPNQWVLYGVLSLPDLNEVYVSFAAPLPGHGYGPSAEVSEARMVARHEVPGLTLAYPPATLAHVLDLYDVIASGELARRHLRVLEMRGRDPGAGES